MQNIIERIARFADIDTRRAMGVKPGKVVIPDITVRIPCIRESDIPGQGYGLPKPLAHQNLKLPVIDDVNHVYNFMYVVDFENGIKLSIHIGSYFTYWTHSENAGDIQWKSFYNFYEESKFVSARAERVDTYNGIHPDFNKDGSFKRSRPNYDNAKPDRKGCTLC